MTQTSLVELAQEDRLDELDLAWSEAATDPAEITPFCRALNALCDRDHASRALTLAESLTESLAGSERVEAAIDVGMALVRRDAHNDKFAQRLLELIQQRFGDEAWYGMVAELSGVAGDSVTGEALEQFDKMRRYTKGHVVYHRGGWGEGLIEAFDPNQRELTIRFASGRTHEVPLTTAFDSMTPLAEDDLRAMALTQMDELQRLVADEPSILIRKCAKIYRGRVTSTEVKQSLSPAIVPTKKWASFWKKAKAAAAVDPYLQVEGSTTRPVFELRKRPLSLADEVERKLRHCDDLGQEIGLLRESLERTSDQGSRDAILDLAANRLAAAAQSSTSSHAHLLDGILLLEEHNRPHPTTSATDELRAMLANGDDPFEPSHFDLLHTQDARLHAVRILPDALGEDWAPLCADRATRLPVSVVEPVIQLLVDRGQGGQLVSQWPSVAPYPGRHPVMTYLLGRAFADGHFAEEPDAPQPVAVARVLLHLARVLANRPRSEQQTARLLTRVSSLLTGRRRFLQGILEDVTREDMSTFLGICERGGPDFPTDINDAVLRAVAKRFPDLTAKPDKPYWQEDAIYVTRAGLEAKREEYHKLTQELIPANAKAIGAAAELGDLSENSEWEAAMEEQRNLTGRASMMDADLRKAKLIEDVAVPSDVVAPGTAVTYTDTGTGQSRTVRVLGPWDCVDEDTVNYLAPAAQPLLGKIIGDTAELPSEHGSFTVRIDAIERLL